jgi:hypothetical protein
VNLRNSGSPDCVLDIVTGIRARPTGVRIKVRARHFSVLQNVQAVSGAHPGSFQQISGFFSQIKQPGREVNHSSPSSADVKHMWSYTATPPICLLGADREVFTFLPLPSE